MTWNYYYLHKIIILFTLSLQPKIWPASSVQSSNFMIWYDIVQNLVLTFSFQTCWYLQTKMCQFFLWITYILVILERLGTENYTWRLDIVVDNIWRILSIFLEWFLWPKTSAWKVSRYGVIFVPYFPVFKLYTKIYAHG